MIEFGQEICTNLSESLGREWVETNGIGGFASSTVAGLNTRRYHGLLVAATTPPTGRLVLLSKFEETLIIDNQKYELSTNAYPNTIYPHGYKFLERFQLAPFPTWTYKIENLAITKTVFMPQGENTAIVSYKFEFLNFALDESDQQIHFELRPLLAFRDYHHLRSNETNFVADYQVTRNTISVEPIGKMPTLNFAFDDAQIIKTNVWYRNFEYQRERERGFDFRENLFQPFALKFQVDEEQTMSIVASTKVCNVADAEESRQKELTRRAEIVKRAGFENEFLQQLTTAADQFIVSRGREKSIIAGYHWFSDWGRDTMIALPGLTLTTNRPEIARSVLLEFSHHMSQGMLPNRFPDVGETPDYNTVDAALWYFEAVRALPEKTGDYDFVEKNLYEKLVEIIVWHLRGTRYNIHVDTDGLLCAGEANMQLTWMDAKFGETVFTPRVGKPVEIQALWYNALRIMQDLAEKYGDRSGKAQYASMADMANISFNQVFWNEAEECLFDCINGGRTASIRPNQIFAVSLEHSMLSSEKARKVVSKVESELFTPFGLRSLSPRDADYRGRYEGDGFARDSAYHQGTVWAWLSGAFFTAYAKVFAEEPGTNEKLNNWLDPFKKHLNAAGIGQISEIFDGDAPHTPRGCIAQAWSVAEILRAAAKNAL